MTPETIAAKGAAKRAGATTARVHGALGSDGNGRLGASNIAPWPARSTHRFEQR
jgi:hypothetical protein